MKKRIFGEKTLSNPINAIDRINFRRIQLFINEKIQAKRPREIKDALWKKANAILDLDDNNRLSRESLEYIARLEYLIRKLLDHIEYLSKRNRKK